MALVNGVFRIKTMFSAHLARQTDIGGVLNALHAACAKAEVDADVGRRACVVVEELVVNAFQHGGAEAQGGAWVEITDSASGATGEVRYDGPAFDPSAPPDGDDGAAMSGDGLGSGLLIIQGLTTALSYARDGQTNRVRFELGAR